MKHITEFKPVGEMILVEMEKVEETTEGGIIIKAQTTMERDQILETMGKIIAVGDNAWEEYQDNPWAKVGDKVIVSRNAGQLYDYKDGGPVYRLMDFRNVRAVLND